MVIKEFYLTRNDGVSLYRSYSDVGFYIRQVETGVVYSEAIDVDGAPYTYEETDELIPEEETDNEKG
jgi:hypothetical protein